MILTPNIATLEADVAPLKFSKSIASGMWPSRKAVIPLWMIRKVS
jgi:hypothetical protein